MAQTAGGTYYAASSELVSSWPATSLDLANQLESRFAAKADYALTQNTQTGTGASAYTFVLADASRLTLANAASAATYTIPPQTSVTWVANSIIQVTSIGAGVITFAGGAGVTVTNTAATLAQYQSAALIRTGSNAWTVVPFSGTGRAAYSATTGSPTITTVSGKTCLQFTGSGSITISRAGFVDALIVGGGGGGGKRHAGGGGGGGFVSFSSSTNPLYLPAGTIQIIVGAGGSGSTVSGRNGDTGYPSAIGDVPNYAVAVGGGGGGSNVNSGVYGGSGGGSGPTNGTTAVTVISQGRNGGAGGPTNTAGGGGGASAVGSNGVAGTAGSGGAGAPNGLTGSTVNYAGGGGGGCATGATAGAGGTGGGGSGTNSDATGAAGATNTGGGGGGGGHISTEGNGGNGGSGIVVLLIG